MGNCCQSNETNEIDQSRNLKTTNNNIDSFQLPKIIIIPKDFGLIFLDNQTTISSIKLKDSLEETFPNLIICDSEKRISILIDLAKKRKYFFIFIGQIQNSTMKYLINHSNVSKIYFSSEQITNIHSNFSRKKVLSFDIDDHQRLKKIIYYHIRTS